MNTRMPWMTHPDDLNPTQRLPQFTGPLAVHPDLTDLHVTN
jgi:hypothetical protein